MSPCPDVHLIRRNGHVDRGARATFFNHQTMADGPPLHMLSGFVHRSKSGAQAPAIEDCSKTSLAMAPEGKTTIGDFTRTFRTGGFLVDRRVLPATIWNEMRRTWVAQRSQA
jgi:hypothetical protein